MMSLFGITLSVLGFLLTWTIPHGLAIDHGPNLIWAQGPHSPLLALSRLVGISGDPSVWVPSKNPQVNFIAAPHFTWVFTSLGFHWQDQSIYWSERSYKKIQRLTLNGSTETTTLFIGTSPEVGGMAVDWLSRNLYFTDSLYDWIIMISSTPGQSTYRIIVNDDLESPHGIVVHPIKGRLFWSDWGSVPKIECSDLLGGGRRTLVQTNDLVSPKGLAIDFQKNRLYWVDSSKSTIESVSLEGEHREILQTGEDKSSFYGLSLYGDYFFVTDRGRQGMLKVFNGNNNIINFRLSDFPYDIIMYDESQQPAGNTSLCEDMTCQQLCIQDPTAGPRCVCGEGFGIDSNDTTQCLPTHRFVHPTHIYAIGDYICQYPANMADMGLQNVNLHSQCFLHEHQGYMTLAFNARSNMLYYFANRTKTISRIPLETKGVGKVLAGGGGIVNGMAYDWIHDILFWADTDQGIIFACAKDCSYQTPVLERLARPFSVAVHPKRGSIFWTAQGHLPDVAPSIEWSYMDGSNRKVIMGDNLGIPTHTYLDYKTDKLYWADSGMNHVRRYDLNTRGITVFFELPGVQFFGISIFKDYILWTDRHDQNGMHAARLDRKEKVRGIIHPKDGIASDLITFDLHNQPMDDHLPPFVNPCAQIYQRQGPDGYRCACGNGYVIGTDGKQCVNKLVSNDFLLVNDAYQRQIFQVDLLTGEANGLKMKPTYEPIALAFDPIDYRVYWSDNKAHSIETSLMGGDQPQLVKTLSNISICDGLAVDYVSRLLFYSDAGHKIIRAVSLTGYSLQTTIINVDLGQPRDIVVSADEGTLYWSDWGERPRIEKAFMDGSGREALVNFTSKAWPNGLALDIRENMLYWVDAYAHRISCMNLVDKTITPLIEEEKSHYFSIQVIGQFLYISDWNRNYIVKMNKRGGSMKRVGDIRFTKMYGIQGFNSSEMSKENGVCSGHTCEHMCLPSGRTTFTCVCADGFEMINQQCVMQQTTAEPEVVVTLSNVTSFGPITLGYPSTSKPPSTPSTPSSTTSTTTTTSSSPSSSSSSSSTMTSRHTPTRIQRTVSPDDIITDSTTGRVSRMSLSSSGSGTVSTTTGNGIDIIISTGKDKSKGNTGGTARANPSTGSHSGSMSAVTIGAIIGAIAILAIVVLIIVVMVTRRRKQRVGHWKLREDASMTDSSVVYHEAHGDSITFDTGGIANPTYDYLHNLPSLDNSNSNTDGFGMSS